MTGQRVYIRGELHLSIECVAELYQVQTVWLRRVHDSGLICGADSAHADSIPAVQLDRVATIVRLHQIIGLDIEAISIALEGS